MKSNEQVLITFFDKIEKLVDKFRRFFVIILFIFVFIFRIIL
jgi:hypothetical protein